MTTFLTDSQESQEAKTVDTAVSVMRVSKKFPLHSPPDKETGIRREDFWALKDISFEVPAGQIFGIIGRNGAGKTTLLNAIAGVLSPTEGEVKIKGRVLGLFNLGVGFQDELSGRENIFLNGSILGASRKELEDKLSAIIDFSEIGDFINMPLGTYSQGMRLRLAFSIVANLDFDVLLLDEVLAVGDVPFQNKCYERIMDFRREGRTLIITTQSMGLIERLCQKAILLDHGFLLCEGGPEEVIGRYRALVATEKFFVGPLKPHDELVTKTKRWAEDVSGWGKKFGAKEVTIDSVALKNKFGFQCSSIKSGEPLKVKVSFSSRDTVKRPHFGVAIFRKDGVYCYGPNTEFDGYYIPELKKGKGSFELYFKKVLLAAGDYRISVAIWDADETLAYDYHNACYGFKIAGENNNHELTALPTEFVPLRSSKSARQPLPWEYLSSKWGGSVETDASQLKSLSLLNAKKIETDIFNTGESMEARVGLAVANNKDKEFFLWIGVFTEDRVYCQGATAKVSASGIYQPCFPALVFLPGAYYLSIGVWDEDGQCLFLSHGRRKFSMIFNRQDHGIVFLPHRWSWQIK